MHSYVAQSYQLLTVFSNDRLYVSVASFEIHITTKYYIKKASSVAVFVTVSVACVINIVKNVILIIIINCFPLAKLKLYINSLLVQQSTVY